MSHERDRFIGSALCGAIGDAIGAAFEGCSYRQILPAYPRPEDLIERAAQDGPFSYTDDTQSSLAVADALLADGSIVPERLMGLLVDHYEPWRGYGAGFRRVVDAYCGGMPVSELGTVLFTDGSFGNGAAMRVAPIALAFAGDRDRRREEVARSCSVSHIHPQAIEGARLLAAGVAWNLGSDDFREEEFHAAMIGEVDSDDFHRQLERAFACRELDDFIELGSEISALESVPTALGIFARHPHDLTACIGTAIQIGGDTDTVASMAGNLFGALRGTAQIPDRLLDALERDNPGVGTERIRETWGRLEAEFGGCAGP